eukprot:16438832-Heterocapsa_arctica.AAC.1
MEEAKAESERKLARLPPTSTTSFHRLFSQRNQEPQGAEHTQGQGSSCSTGHRTNQEQAQDPSWRDAEGHRTRT